LTAFGQLIAEVLVLGTREHPDCPTEAIMLWTIAVLLVIFWFLGMVSSYTLGGFVHILLLLAVAAVLIRIIQGRNPI
jgi:hypothetical protein